MPSPSGCWPTATPRPLARRRPLLPPAPAGSVRLGSDLAAPGRTVDCRGRPAGVSAPLCTIFQERASDDRTLVVPRNGVVRRWAVRSASGELALTVMRRSDAGFFQIARSRSEFVSDDRAHAFPTALAVEQGDRLGLVAIDASGVGLRGDRGATTGRFEPDLIGFPGRQPADGPAGELLLRADLVPGDRTALPPQISGARAAAAPDGSVLARGRARFRDGTRMEARLVVVDRRGYADFLHDGRRVVRLTLPGPPPAGPDARVSAVVTTDGPRHYGVDLAYTRAQSQRLVRHFIDLRRQRVRYFG